MKATLNKPYLICWLAIPLLILLGIVFIQHTTAIQLADTYYVIGKLYWALAASSLLLIIGAGYWLINRKNTTNRTLTAIHLLLTLTALVTFTLPLSDSPGHWLVWVAIVLVMSQVLYIINIFVTLLQQRSSPIR